MASECNVSSAQWLILSNPRPASPPVPRRRGHHFPPVFGAGGGPYLLAAIVQSQEQERAGEGKRKTGYPSDNLNCNGVRSVVVPHVKTSAYLSENAAARLLNLVLHVSVARFKTSVTTGAHVRDRHSGRPALGAITDASFREARDQIVRALPEVCGGREGCRVVQLGDLGGYACDPGSQQCFDTAKDFLSGFGFPVGVITGNHDLEGEEFKTDEDNLAAWLRTFCQDTHYWSKDLGAVLAIGLSTVRFRSNKHSAHEVFIDDAQMRWFEETVEANSEKNIVVFSHAPPMGCGLKVVQSVHVKNRCAWLNHSSDPGQFMRIVNNCHNIKLWFSGHFHLSQNYAESISVLSNTAFVQTGVIGECNRDNLRQSRILKFDAEGFEVYTIDHDDESLRLDLSSSWNDPRGPPIPEQLAEELLCDPEDGDLCCGLEDCDPYLDWKANKRNTDGSPVRWISAGGDVLLAHQNNMLVEYHDSLCAPVGVVCLDTRNKRIRMIGADGDEVSDVRADHAVAVEFADLLTGEIERVPRNDANSFYRIYQPNKWRIRKQREAAEARDDGARNPQNTARSYS
eukprot:CAMPEP_0177753994 /NCGR_PEP_ID=MMETSP0491_2-20121128/1768_1 /TAXON_ID=63592 /ORGANISM="Tetraselmis chuii, Strain PLY429" /LENGTH=568 /DNA_ID=CAMNT_0019269339 /DNA_START=71 /DNA_END=1779 /DNA_ORIENTATION=-